MVPHPGERIATASWHFIYSSRLLPAPHSHPWGWNETKGKATLSHECTLKDRQASLQAGLELFFHSIVCRCTLRGLNKRYNSKDFMFKTVLGDMFRDIGLHHREMKDPPIHSIGLHLNCMTGFQNVNHRKNVWVVWSTDCSICIFYLWESFSIHMNKWQLWWRTSGELFCLTP